MTTLSVDIFRKLSIKLKQNVVVAICTKGESKLFRECVISVIEEDLSSDSFDFKTLIIINNTNSEFREEIFIKTIQKMYRNVNISILNEPKIGIPFARNRALKYAISEKYDYLAFIDDDCVAQTNWLQELIQTQVSLGVDVIQGSFRFNYPKIMPFWYPRFPDSCYFEGQELPTGITRSVLFNLEKFNDLTLDTEFDINLKNSGGSDTKFFYYLVQVGLKIRACTKSIVIEDMSERYSLKWIFFRYLRGGHGYFRLMFRDKKYPNSKKIEFKYILTHFKLVLLLAIKIIFSVSFGAASIYFGQFIVETGQLIGIIMGLLGIKLRKYH